MRLVLASDASARTRTCFRQAGGLLRLLHDQVDLGVVDGDYEARETAKCLAWLDQPHRISPVVEARLRAEIAGWPAALSTTLVPTHGDWQPRNWLVDGEVVSVIDFGRADLRPATTDLARLAAQEFRGGPEARGGLLRWVRGRPREPAAWQRIQVREAVGVAVWAFRVGDGEFEAQGHRMIAEAIDHR